MDNTSIEQRLIVIENEVHKLNTKVDQILELLNSAKTSCDKMDTHIDFVNNTYKTLKAPLDYISHSFNNTKNLLK